MAKPIKCRAAILYKENTPLIIEDVIIPEPGSNQLRIKMIASGICASDGHYVWGQQKLSDVNHLLPIVLGHEGAGIVESVGSNINDIVPGDHVLTTFSPCCQNCSECNLIDNNACLNYLFFMLGTKPTRKLSKNGNDLYGGSGIGCYSEYITIDRPQVVKIKKTENLTNFSIISCAVATGFYSAVNQAKVRSGSTCAIWGIGGIGINVLQGCKYNNAKNIIAIDINPDKRDIAMKFGATEFINPKDLENKTLEKFLMEKYGGVDYAFDCYGSQLIIDQALNSLSLSGKFIMVGVSSPDVIIKYPALSLLSGRTITGSLLGGKKSYDAYPEIIDLYLNNKIKINEMITNRLKLNEINEAFSTLKDGKCIRSIIVFDD